MKLYQSWLAATTAKGENELVAVVIPRGRIIGDRVETIADSDREPKYFLMPADADDITRRAMAFEATYGEPMDEYQRRTLQRALEG